MDASFFTVHALQENLESVRNQGRHEVRVESIMIVLEHRGIEVPFFVSQRISHCLDPDILRTWLIRALTATSAVEVIRNE
ncbi:hypothetical protein FE633_06460 [Streptomyces montanus]|uniref:Uncharacterized protein n=1 Tax=Streptomyces montanus TaxID=2580423 RepID=A0A5R9G5F4_9ACTN|nr:hypothetical protein [Streptomyces montanus]TLS46765.1 hypothetical protein FE633_06460 [Streptomyces montanus]